MITIVIILAVLAGLALAFWLRLRRVRMIASSAPRRRETPSAHVDRMRRAGL